MRCRYVGGVSTIGVAAAVYIVFARPRQLRWGASAQECEASLAGDDLIPSPDLTATRAITIRASAGRVWPWIAQLNQHADLRRDRRDVPARWDRFTSC